jgi:penicillin-binding protein 1A
LEVFRLSNHRRPGGDEPRRPKKKKRSRRWLGYTILVLFGLMLGVGGFAASFAYKAYQSLPAWEDYDPSQTSLVLDSKGSTVYQLAAEENRTPIKDIKSIPKEVQLAFVSTEDRRFYEHSGIDIWRLGGAVFSDIKYYLHIKGAQFEGASTITMQLAGNAFLDRQDMSPRRKVQEMLLAVQLERNFTKDEILLRYLNQVSFGYQAAGLEQAAQTYFSKSAKDLTLSEAAMLAGMLKAPTTYNPFDNYEGAMKRRATVLDLMVTNHYIDAARATQLKAEKVQLKPAKVTPTTVTFTGDWYVDYVIKILTDPNVASRYGTPVFNPDDLYSKGLKIYTALDVDWQKTTQEKLAKVMPEQTKEFGGKEVPEASVVIMDHTNGYVKALVGGMEHKQMLGYNRATQAYRQPGSSIKPIAAYLPAIDTLGWGPATVVDDAPLLLSPDGKGVWPDNYEHYYRGLLPLRYALEQSINTVAVRSLQAVTPRKSIEYAHKFGLTSILDASGNPSQNDQNLSLALGGLTTGVTPLDLTAAYGALGSLGVKVDPVVITKIENKHGEIIFEANPRRQQIVNKDSVWLMVDIMKGVIIRGTASSSVQGFKGWPAAGKTGTTEDWHDAWFVGFTPQIVTGVWTGYDNDQGRKTLPGAGTGYAWTGAGPPAKIWTAIMTDIIKEKPKDWERPPGITWVEVCKTSGMLPSPLCPKEEVGGDWFRKGFEPKQADNVWTLAKAVKQTTTATAGGKPEDRYVLWKPDCGGTPEDHLFIKRPDTFARHPLDPNNPKYWPQDWVKEVPTQYCEPVAAPPTTQPPTSPSDPSWIPIPDPPGNTGTGNTGGTPTLPVVPPTKP